MLRERVFKLVSKVPRGRVTTYKILAKKAVTSPRAVGSIMRSNPYPVQVPCHRAVMSDGRVGGYAGSKEANIKKKIRLLRSEGIEFKNNKINLEKHLFHF
jgi:methylated-DNA-[protein]-cysteine S-methyltransferase